MNFYSILKNQEKYDQDDEWVVLTSGFSFQAFLFGVFWLMYNNMWKLSLLIFLYGGIMGYLENIKFLNELQVMFFSIIPSLYLGLEGSELKSESLQARGYKLEDVLYASSEEDALLKYYNKIESRWN